MNTDQLIKLYEAAKAAAIEADTRDDNNLFYYRAAEDAAAAALLNSMFPTVE